MSIPSQLQEYDRQLNLKRQITAMNSKLIVVSNRLPFVLKREDNGELVRSSSAGGLVTAVAPVVVGCDGYWIGWPGKVYKDGDKIPEPDPNDRSPTSGLKSKQVIPVDVDNDLFDAYYNGCCNATFWPLFHSMPDRATFQADHWKAYETVNLKFGEEVIRIVKEVKATSGDKEVVPIVWVHDYHLMLAPNTIRAISGDSLNFKMSFFLHIPFPSWDIFRLFPWADEVLQGMLACDMVGFHTEDYCLNFIECCQRCLGCRVDRQSLLVELGGRTIRIRPLPVGIPYSRFQSLAETAPEVLKTKQKIILGVDRLDYTKGLTHRLRAFEILLEKYPEFIGEVTLLQIAVPTRGDVKEYQDLKEEMEKLVGRINGRFTTPNWSPIRYIYGTVSQEELAAFYRDASVALVTPLRDGMNLVAMEFVACQIKSPPGVLILSPFAGAAGILLEALVCNIYELDQAASVLKRALVMPEDERTVRMNLLKRRVKAGDVDAWMKSFLKAMGTLLLEDGDEVLPTIMQPFTLKDFDGYLSKIIGPQHKLVLLLDYDGTLSPLAPHPDLAILPHDTKITLQKLASLPDIHISIVSGRDVENVKKMVGIENVTYAGNHGLSIVHPDGTRFVHPMPPEYEKKAKDLLQTLQEQVVKDGAWVEMKGVFLTWHYRNTPVDLRPELVKKARELIEAEGFIAAPAHAAIEAKPPIEWNKGRASLYILRTAFGLDWSERIRIIYVGDDVTDEDAMQALKGIAVTFRVTQSQMLRTAADHRLPDTGSVLTLLKWVEKHFTERANSSFNGETAV